MGFLDSVKNLAGDVGNTVKKGAKTGSDNVKKAAEKAKIKRDISNCESELTKTYAEIGKKFFETIRSNPTEDYLMEAETIMKIEKQIEDAKKELAALEDKHNCPSCGAAIFKEQRFCDKCGAKIEEPVDEEETENVETVDAEIVETTEENE